MKQSRIRRLIPKKLARRYAEADESGKAALEARIERESSRVVGKMAGKGFTLVTRLPDGDGVFVREHDVVGLHVQLRSDLYERLDSWCRESGRSKREAVTEALEAWLEASEEG